MLIKSKKNKPTTHLIVVTLSILFSIPLLAQDFDQYGGALAKHFNAEQGEGFFRVKKEEGQWWLVTPENNAFLSYGLNHFHANLWSKDWNKDHWETEFNGGRHSETWKGNFYEHAKEVTSLVNTNTLGYHNEDQILLSRSKFLPYIAQYIPVELSMHTNPTAVDFIDIFSDDFVQLCADKAQEQVLPHINDPLILGFAMSDIPTLTEYNAKSVQNFKGYNISTWARVLRNLPASAPGKVAYVESMKVRYNNNISNFNTTYGTSFSSWEELKNTENWRSLPDLTNDTELTDNNEFNKLCINKYYEVASAAFRAVNSNHLFFGDKLNANLFTPEELPLIVNEIKDYVDAVMIQCFANNAYHGRVHDRITGAADLPIINGDVGFGAKGDPNMPNPQYPPAENQAERAEWLTEYAESSFSNPNYIGFYMCGVIDSHNPYGTQKPGIMDPYGNYHTDVTNALAKIGNDLYAYRGLNTDMTEYSLTVNGGSGDGLYKAGTSVSIAAAVAPSGQMFDKWTGDITNIENPFKANTTIATPSGNATIAATYRNVNTDLNIIKNGYFSTGDISHWGFWNATTSTTANVENEQIVISIASSTDVWRPSLQQDEISLTIGKEYMLSFDAKAVAARTLDIKLQYASNAFAINELVGLTTSMQNYSFTFTANEGDAKIKFNCGNSIVGLTLDNIILRENPAATTYSLSVTNGAGSGNYVIGETVSISADDAPTDQVFDKWTGDIANIAEVNSPNTTIRLLSGQADVTANYISTLSIDSITPESHSRLNFYPNPVTNMVYFENASDYEIYTILGKKLLEGKNAIEVDVSMLSSGLYLVKTPYGFNKMIKQ